MVQDITAALTWTKTNINKFGGDPDRVSKTDVVRGEEGEERSEKKKRRGGSSIRLDERRVEGKRDKRGI